MVDSIAPIFSGKPQFPVAGSEPGQTGTVDAASQRAQWLALIAQVGPEAAAAQVKGDFAVALPLPDGSVFMAVDRFAVRTLCWRQDSGHLAVAQRADELGQGELDPQALFDYLYFHIIPAPRTVFAGVQRLPAGHFALWRNGELTVKPYWRPEFQPMTGAPDFNALRDEFRALLQAGVARELDGGQPACFLSGGTDSSTVTGMVGLAAGRPAVAYSIGFEADGYDEMAFARMAAQHFGAEHRELYYEPKDLLRDIPVVAGGYDQPFGNSSALPSYFAAGIARQDGATRILAGDGGDELFGGNSRYAQQRLFDHYERVPRWLRSGLLEPVFGLPLVARTPGLSKGSSYIRQANTPMPARAQEYNLLKRLGYGDVLTETFRRQTSAALVDVQQAEVWAGIKASDEINRHLGYDWRYTLAECDLPKVVGTTQMAGVDVGFPMLDHALVEFSARLPMDYKLRGPALRWFFKEALKGFLPEGVITKQKQGFGLPFGVWMVQHPGLKAMAQDALSAVAERGIVRRDFVQALFNERLPEHPHYYGTMVWILIMLEHWMRQHAPDWKLPDSAP